MLPYEIVRKRVETFLFFGQIFPLWFNSKSKKDNGSFQKVFPKNFFGFLHPGDLGTQLTSEPKLVSASRARDAKKW